MNKTNLDSAAVLADEKEKRLAEERSTAALKLQRKQRLQAMIQKRRTNLSYLKEVHQGGCFWLNAVLFSCTDVNAYVARAASKQRVESFFMLGVSISRILDLEAGLPIIRAFSQLMEEWEYVNSGHPMQGVKFMMAKTSTCLYPQTIASEVFADLSRPSVYKFNNQVVFEYLQVPHIPFELDYVEVLFSLFDEMNKLYVKLMHEECYSNQLVYNNIVRLDTKVKHYIINLISKELTEVCITHKLKRNTASLRGLMNRVDIINTTRVASNKSSTRMDNNHSSTHSSGNRRRGSSNAKKPHLLANITIGSTGNGNNNITSNSSSNDRTDFTTTTSPTAMKTSPRSRSNSTTATTLFNNTTATAAAAISPINNFLQGRSRASSTASQASNSDIGEDGGNTTNTTANPVRRQSGNSATIQQKLQQTSANIGSSIRRRNAMMNNIVSNAARRGSSSFYVASTSRSSLTSNSNNNNKSSTENSHSAENSPSSDNGSKNELRSRSVDTFDLDMIL